MTLEEKIFSDYKDALKARDSLKSSILSLLRADILKSAVDKNKSKLDEAEVIVAIKKQIKQHQDSIEQFQKGARLELAEKEAKELEIIKTYLPAQLGESELVVIVNEAVAVVGAQGMKDMGKVMADLMPKVKGKADNSEISKIIKELLSK